MSSEKKCTLLYRFEDRLHINQSSHVTTQCLEANILGEKVKNGD